MTELISFLNSVRHAKVEQERLQRQIAELDARCTKITASLSAVPGGGNADAQRQWAALADKRALLTDLLEREMHAITEVETWIKELRRERSREVLLYRYVNLMTVPEITAAFAAAGVPYSQRQIERFLTDALADAYEKWRGEHHEQSRDP